MRVCFVVHTPFQLVFASVMMKQINAQNSLLISLEDGRNQLDKLHSFIESNWSDYRYFNVRKIKPWHRKIFLAKTAELQEMNREYPVICLWSIHTHFNKAIMQWAKQKGKKVYIFPEGLISLDYFWKGLHWLVKKYSGRYNYCFDYFFTYFSLNYFNDPRVKEMPFLLNHANFSRLSLPMINTDALSDYNIIYFSQAYTEGKLTDPEEEQRFLTRIFKTFSNHRILVFPHPRDNPNKFSCFPNVHLVPSSHYPNEIYLSYCQPKLVISGYSTILLHSALQFPHVPHVLLYKLITVRRLKKKLKSLDLFFGNYPNAFVLDSFEQMESMMGRTVNESAKLPGISITDFLNTYFSG
jgi:hypothetical protein